jgi:hypothetical protein
MKKIKIAKLWLAEDFENSVIFQLIKNITKKDIEFVSAINADIIVFGPYDTNSIKRRLFNYGLKKLRNLENFFPNIDLYLLNRKIKPLRIFYSHENYVLPKVNYDFSITTRLGIEDDLHLRYPAWKDLIDWTNEGITRKPWKYIKRFDNFYPIQDLMSAQGDSFMKKERKICIISSHLDEPRKSLYLNFSKNFPIDGHGPFFNKKIQNHYLNPSKKKDILKNYSFNLCPENSLYPGYYTEKVPEAFLSKCLPLTWADNNINLDFNEKSFVNLLNYSGDNYFEINNLLKDENFLKKYTMEPLLLKKPNLDKEITFVKKIFDSV